MRVTGMGNVACMVEVEKVFRILLECLKGRYYSAEANRIMLKWI
jgi:hypothetical protein